MNDRIFSYLWCSDLWLKVVGSNLNHTPRTHISTFKVEALVLGYHQYKAIWDAQVGKQLQ